MPRYFFISFLSIFFFHSFSIAQIAHKIDSLKRIYQNAKTESDKVKASGVLADYYFTYQMDREGDSVLQNQLSFAESLNDSSLILATYFGKAVTYISKWKKKETFERAIQFIQNGLAYSKSIDERDFETLSYIRLASLYRKSGDLDNSLKYANLAYTSSFKIKNDSIKILADIEVGNSYLEKEELAEAFNWFNKAYDFAVEKDKYTLQSQVFHRLAQLYRSIDDSTKETNNLNLSLGLNIRYNNLEGQIYDYIDLARATNKLHYLKKAISLSDSLNLENYLLQAKLVMYGYYTMKANIDSTLNFINENSDLKESWINIGMPYYYLNMGSIYQYSKKSDKKDSTNKLDSAIYYLKLAQQGYEKDNNEKNIQDIYSEIGTCYTWLDQPDKAIIYFEKAFALHPRIKNLQNASYYCEALSRLYEDKGDFKKAFNYSRLNDDFKDSLQVLVNHSEITRNEFFLIDIQREKAVEMKELEEEQEVRKKRIIQYWVISISITIIFFLLIIVGMLTVSRLFIKLVGYIAFISLFEFIVLMIDFSFLKGISNEEPLLFWFFKIILIAILVPLQHYMQQKLTRYLQTRKKIQFFSFKKWLLHQKKPIEVAIENIDKIEKDTTVL